MSGQFDGLADRTRVFPPSFTRQQFEHIEVKSIKMGGILLQPVGGTRYANGRMSIEGVADNSCEVQQMPGPDCAGKGVMTQWLMFTRRVRNHWMRHCWSWNFDGEGDLWNEDDGVSGDRVQAPQYRKAGERTFEEAGVSSRDGKEYAAGEDDGGRYVEAIFADGSDEVYLPDGRRVTKRSLYTALVQLAGQSGIALEIR